MQYRTHRSRTDAQSARRAERDGERRQRQGIRGSEKFYWNDSVIFELLKSETNIKPDITDDITSAKLGKRRSAATSRATRQDLIG